MVEDQPVHWVERVLEGVYDAAAHRFVVMSGAKPCGWSETDKDCAYVVEAATRLEKEADGI